MGTDMMTTSCIACDHVVEAETLEELSADFLAHVRAEHDLPYGDQAVRNYAEATQRLTGSPDRVDTIGSIDVQPVTSERVDDWLELFDHHGFVGKPEWAGCYCLEPHELDPSAPPADDVAHWRDKRVAMVERLHSGTAFGYLAYVDDQPAGWVNASLRRDYALYRRGDGAEPADDQVVGISCFVVAPAYRQHGVSGALLDRVVADAGARGATWVEAYPFTGENDGPASFRGSRAFYEAAGFEQVKERARDVVMGRRPG
jgi:GNAT superfamily N-acetyltransferase